jgi:hypothetical protein
LRKPEPHTMRQRRHEKDEHTLPAPSTASWDAKWTFFMSMCWLFFLKCVYVIRLGRLIR